MVNNMTNTLYKLCRNTIPLLKGLIFRFNNLRSNIYIRGVCRIGKGSSVALYPGCTCTMESSTIGKNSYISVLKSGTLFLGKGVGVGNCNQIICQNKIAIGDDTILGPNVYIYDHNHQFTLENGVDRWNYDIDEVIIGKKTWIGANVVILKGVHIGDNCVIGAGSVVTKDIPSHCVAVGNPAKIIKHE